MPAADLVILRRLLGEALEASLLLGDEPRPEPDGVGYFADEDNALRDAIERIAVYTGPIAPAG